MPCHDTASKPGTPASATVGISGATGKRCALVIASARKRPARACGNATCTCMQLICTSPAISAVICSAAPLYGT